MIDDFSLKRIASGKKAWEPAWDEEKICSSNLLIVYDFVRSISFFLFFQFSKNNLKAFKQISFSIVSKNKQTMCFHMRASSRFNDDCLWLIVRHQSTAMLQHDG